MSELDLSKKRLEWQCRRGMLELDVLLKRYLDDQYEQLNDEQKAIFQDLLSLEDPILWAYITDQEQPEIDYKDMIDVIRQWSDL